MNISIEDIFNGTKYKTETKITLQEISKDILNEDITDIDSYEDLIDIMKEIIFEIYPYYRQVKIRQEQNNILKSIKKLNETYQCEVCGITTKNIQMHHKIPVCKLGGNEKENITLCCPKCHKKEDKKSFKRDEKINEQSL